MRTTIRDRLGNAVFPPQILGYHYIGSDNPVMIGDLWFPPSDFKGWTISRANEIQKNENVGKYLTGGKIDIGYGLYRKIINGYVCITNLEEKIIEDDILMMGDGVKEGQIISMLNTLKAYAIKSHHLGMGRSINEIGLSKNSLILRPILQTPRQLSGNRHYGKPLPLP